MNTEKNEGNFLREGSGPIPLDVQRSERKRKKTKVMKSQECNTTISSVGGRRSQVREELAITKRLRDRICRKKGKKWKR